MDFSQNGYWHVATMMLRPYYQRKAEGCCLRLGLMARSSLQLSLFAHGLLWGSGAVRRPLMRTGRGRAWAPNTAWLCLPGLSFRGGKRYRTLVLTRSQSALACREESPGSRQKEAAAGPLPRDTVAPQPGLCRQLLCFTSFTSHPATSVSLSWFLKGFLSTWQGRSSLFPQEIGPKMQFPPLSVTQPLVLKQDFL